MCVRSSSIVMLEGSNATGRVAAAGHRGDGRGAHLGGGIVECTSRDNRDACQKCGGGCLGRKFVAFLDD